MGPASISRQNDFSEQRLPQAGDCGFVLVRLRRRVRLQRANMHQVVVVAAAQAAHLRRARQRFERTLEI